LGKKSSKSILISLAIIILIISTAKTEGVQATSSMINGVLAHSLTDTQAETIAFNGIMWVRSDVSLEQQSNWYSIYHLTKTYNLSLIGTLDPYTLNFNHSANWQQTVKSAVNAYGDKVSVWEIWNEPTRINSYCGTYQGTAQQYVDIMKTAYQTIKSEYPNAIVLGLGGLPVYSGEDKSYLQQSLIFAQNVCSLGGMRYCDAVSLHAYPYGNNPYFQDSFKTSIDSYKQITGKDVWITETGQESGTNSFNSNQNIQASYLTQSYLFMKSEDVEAYIWYELNDNNIGNSADYQNASTFGLYDTKFSPKQVLVEYFEAVSPIPTPTNSITNPTPTATLPEFSASLAIIFLLVTTLAVAVVLGRKHPASSSKNSNIED
jgi:hypothetical protein